MLKNGSRDSYQWVTVLSCQCEGQVLFRYRQNLRSFMSCIMLPELGITDE